MTGRRTGDVTFARSAGPVRPVRLTLKGVGVRLARRWHVDLCRTGSAREPGGR